MSGADDLLIAETERLLQIYDAVTCRCTDLACSEPHDRDGGEDE